MDTGSQWAIIVALAGTLSAVVGGALRYLLKEIEKRDAALIEANKAMASVNQANAELVQRWIDQHMPEPKVSPSRRERS